MLPFESIPNPQGLSGNLAMTHALNWADACGTATARNPFQPLRPNRTVRRVLLCKVLSILPSLPRSGRETPQCDNTDDQLKPNVGSDSIPAIRQLAVPGEGPNLSIATSSWFSFWAAWELVFLRAWAPAWIFARALPWAPVSQRLELGQPVPVALLCPSSLSDQAWLLALRWLLRLRHQLRPSRRVPFLAQVVAAEAEAQTVSNISASRCASAVCHRAGA